MLSGQFSRQGMEEACPEGFSKICEGSAAVLFPPAMVRGGHAQSAGNREQNHMEKKAEKAEEGEKTVGADVDDQAVFYNPAQVVNRDLSVCAIQLFANQRASEPWRRGGTGQKGITVLEALSATGLRAIRYFKEIAGVRYIIANDLDNDAVGCIRRNCAFNGIPAFAPGIYDNFPSAPITSACPPPSQQQEEEGASASSTLDKAGIIPNLDDAIDLMYRLGMNQNVHHYPNATAQQEGQREHQQQQQQQQPVGKRMVLLNDTSIASTPRSAPSAAATTTVAGGNVQGVLQQELMDVVDLDPYGTASPFLDAAFGCIKEGGLMLVTSTDSAILCGNYIDTCHAKYNAVPYKGSHCHEMAVRILLGCIERVANKHKKYIVPLLSLHIDFYVRCFFRVYTQPAEVKLSPCKLGYQLQCSHCPAFWVRPMTTAAPRVTKAERKAQTRGGGLKRGRQSESEFTASTHNTEREDTTAFVDKDAKRVDIAAPPAPERYPATPSRQDNPKLRCLTMEQLPALHHNPFTQNTTAAAAAAAAVAENQKEEASITVDRKGHGSCPVCGVGAVTLSGPLYAAPTQNVEFLDELAKLIAERDAAAQITATARISGLVQLASEELPNCPLFYNLPDVSSYVKVRCPPTPQFVAALSRLGYRCSQVHCCAAGLKTDCPPEVLFAVMLSWKVEADAQAAAAVVAADTVEEEEEKKTGLKRPAPQPPALLVGPYTPAAAVDFSYDPKVDFRGRVTGKAKFVPNAPGWGPKRRHQGALHQEPEE